MYMYTKKLQEEAARQLAMEKEAEETKQVYVYANIYAYVHLQGYVCVYIYIYIYIFMCMYVSRYVYVQKHATRGGGEAAHGGEGR